MLATMKRIASLGVSTSCVYLLRFQQWREMSGHVSRDGPLARPGLASKRRLAASRVLFDTEGQGGERGAAVELCKAVHPPRVSSRVSVHLRQARLRQARHRTGQSNSPMIPGICAAWESVEAVKSQDGSARPR